MEFADLEIVDTDMHITEKQDDFFPYLPDPFDKLFAEQSDEEEYASTHQNFYPSSGYLTQISRGTVNPDTLRTKDDVMRAMNLLDVDKSVITPSQNLHLPGVHHDELAVALASAYNSWVLETMVDESEGLYTTTLIAPQIPDKAAEEIDDRADESGMVGVMLPSGGVNPPLGDERYYPIYEACEDAGLPLLLHGSTGESGMWSFPFQHQGTKRWLEIHTFAHVAQSMMHFTSMLTHGIPVRFPDLDVVFQEGGLGWIPFMTRRIDHEYAGNKDDAPMLEKMPSEYVNDQFYFTSQPVEGTGDPEYVSQTVRAFNGADRLMFSSDYPHFDFDNTDELMKLLQGFDDEEIENIYGRTALELFDF